MTPAYVVLAYTGLAGLCIALGIGLGASCGRVVAAVLRHQGALPEFREELSIGAGKWLVTARRCVEIGVACLVASVPVAIVMVIARFVMAVVS